jgi:hypothetical protein
LGVYKRKAIREYFLKFFHEGKVSKKGQLLLFSDWAEGDVLG